MSSTALIVLAIVAIPAAVLAYRLLQNHQTAVAQTASTCGEVAYPGGTLDPSAWYIGPPLPASLGGTKSPGQPLHPAPLPSGQPGFRLIPPIGSLPRPLGVGDKLDSTAFKHGPLTGKKQIHLILNADYAAGAELLAVPEQDPAAHFLARITIYFQQDGDPWTAAGQFESFRQYYDVDFYVKQGINEVIAPLDSMFWGGTEFSTNNPADKGGTNPDGSRKPEYNPAGLKAAIDNCCCVGFGFGGDEVGRIHGCFATGQISLDVVKFEVS